MRVAVISLKRTPERWSLFLKRNRQALKDCELLRIDGIDGKEIIDSGLKTRLINPSARQRWSTGAIGVGLTHLFCWRLCCNSRTPLVVLEDDVLLADNWLQQLKQLLKNDEGMMLLGWNLDSVLRTKYIGEQEIISLFEPSYPSEKALHDIVNSNDSRQSKQLRYAFGLPGYWLDPRMAEQLLNTIIRLESVPLFMGRGFPEVSINGIDGLLNLTYYRLGTKIIVPPLALATNDQKSSLTRNGAENFA